MIDMKCPFCGEKLQQTYSFNPKQFWCSNYYDHKHPINLQGTKELWQELIRTRKMLKIAVGAIETIKYSKKSDAINLRHKANKALIEIWKIKDQTALEQKDKR